MFQKTSMVKGIGLKQFTDNRQRPDFVPQIP